METSRGNLGVIMCRYCGCIIDKVDTEKVSILHGVCSQEPCVTDRERKDGLTYEC
jgi:hypothetical protein